MPIENRNLAVGTRLVAKYKKVTYFCEVVETEAGVRYRLEDGRGFKSPSAAGTAVLGGQACNGWRFWSAEATKEDKEVGSVMRSRSSNSRRSLGLRSLVEA